jgi:hypothetical protein
MGEERTTALRGRIRCADDCCDARRPTNVGFGPDPWVPLSLLTEV